MENKSVSLFVVSLGKALYRTPHLYVADRWPTRTSPGYNCEIANPACRKPPVAVRLVDGGATSYS